MSTPDTPLTQAELDDIILKHNMFMRGKPGGARALLKFRNMAKLNFKGCDLTGADFTACVLHNANMSGGNFTNGIFYGADMQQANLEGAIFRRADFRGAYIAGANLMRADLAAADLREGKILERGHDGTVVEREAGEGQSNPRTVLTGARMTHTNLSGVRAKDADFSDADLSGVIIRGSDLRNVNFKGANLSNTDLSGSDMRDCNLQDAVLTGIIMEQTEVAGIKDTGAVKGDDAMGETFDARAQNLEFQIKEHMHWVVSVGAKGKQLDLSGFDLRTLANLRENILTAIVARKATFLGLNLHKIQLQTAMLDDADFRDCNLSNSDLRAAHLKGANLARADLSQANLGPLHFGKPGEPGHRIRTTILAGANLRYAQLVGANLQDIDLTGADLSYANLSGADLRRAHLDGATLTDAKMDGTQR